MALKNTAKSPTWKTRSSESLLDVIITSKDNLDEKTSVVDLGISHHLAQVMRINTGPRSPKAMNKKTERRKFTQNHIERFKNLMCNESWVEVCSQSDVNNSVKAFMDIFLFHFETVFPYKRVMLSISTNGKWLSKGILISSKRTKHLNNIRRIFPPSKKDLEYIKKSINIYRKIIREAKKEKMIGMLN